MKQPDSEDLSEKLRNWRVNVKVPADFQQQVWQRIAAREEARENALGPSLWALVSQFFARPATTVAIIVLSFTVGLGIAHGRASAAHAHAWHVLEDRYADTINPLARHVHHLVQ